MRKIGEKIAYSSILKRFKKYCVFATVLILLMTFGCKKNVHTIDFKDYDGTLLKTILVEEGQVPNYGTNPEREADEDYEYVFKSWDRALKKATEDTEYQAQYDAIEKVETYTDDPTIMHDINGNEVVLDPNLEDKYCTVSFVDDDGTLIQKMRVKYGSIPVYSGETPVKIDSNSVYTFDGWDKDLDIVLKDTTYTATYTKSTRTNVGYNASTFDIGNFVKYPEISNSDNSKYSKESQEAKANETYYTVTVSVTNSSQGTASGGGKYLEGKTATISALAKVGYEFDKWNDGDTNNPRSFQVNKDEEFYPIFKSVPTHKVNVLFNNNSIAQVSGNSTYNIGSTAQISFKLLKSERYKFLGWDDNGDGFPDGNTDNPRSIIVSDDSSFTPIFEEIPPQPVNITVKVKDGDSDKGVATGSGTFIEDSVTVITAIPKDGYHFVQWNDNNTSNPRSIVVSSSTKEYIASFTTNIYKINGLSNNALFGSVSGGGDYSFGSKVTLKAQAKTGYRFYKWSDGSYQNPREENVLEQKDYTAIFIESKVPSKGDYISFDKFEDTKYLVLNVDSASKKATLLSTAVTTKTKYTDTDTKYFGSQLETVIQNAYSSLPVDIKNSVVDFTFVNNKYTENNDVKDTNHASISVYPATDKSESNKVSARSLTIDDIELFFGGASDNAGAYNSTDLANLLNISVNDSVWLSSLNDDETKAYYVDNTNEGCSIKTGSLNDGERLVRYVFDIDITKAKYIIDEEKFVSTAVPKKITVNASPSVIGWGTIEGSGSYNIGTRVNIKAVEASGCKFIKWDKAEYTDKTISLVPLTDINLIATFYKKVNPQKGDVLYFDDSKDKSYVVIDYDENGIATLLSRDKYSSADVKYGNNSYSESGMYTACADYFSEELSDAVTDHMEKDYSIKVYEYEANNIGLHLSHASNAIVPNLDNNVEEVSGVDVYVPGVEDIEKFFSTESTKGMASVYSGSHLQQLFNISSDETILLNSSAGNNECFVVKKVDGSYQIINESKTISNAVIHPIFKIALSSSSNVEFTISDHLNFTAVTPLKYSVTGSVNDSSLGEIEGLNNYTIGSRVTLNAKDKGDGKFLRWGNEEFTTNPVSFIVNNNINVYAEFYIKRDPQKGDIISFDSLQNKSFIVLDYDSTTDQAVLLSRNDYGTNTVFDANHKSYDESSIKNKLNDYANALPSDIKAKLVNSKDASITNQKYSSSVNAFNLSSHSSRAVIPGYSNSDFNYTAFLPGVDDIEKFFATSETDGMASVYSSDNLKELFGETSSKPILLRTEDRNNPNNSFAVVKGNEQYQIVSQSKNTAACTVRPVIIVTISMNGDLGFKIEKAQTFTPASALKYQVSVTSNDSSLGNLTETKSYTVGTRVEIKAEPKEGCKFIGWENQEFTDNPYSFIPVSDESYKAIFYQARNPQKGDVLYFDDQKEKTYFVLEYDEANKIATLLCREDYLDNVTYSEDKFAGSQLQTKLNNFITTLPSNVASAVKNANITINKFDTRSTVIKDSGHASSVIIPSLGSYESVSEVSAYLPSVDDIEKYFATSETADMASVYSGANLKELFNIVSNKPILLGSRNASNNNFAVVNKNGSYLISEQANTTTNCVVRPVFKVTLSKDGDIDYTIQNKQVFSSATTLKYYIQTTSSSDSLGTITNGNKFYTIGTRVSIKANANNNNVKFSCWEPSTYSNTNPLTIIPTSNIALYAVFYEKRDPVKNEIIFFDSDDSKSYTVLDFNGTTKVATVLSRDNVTGKKFDSDNSKNYRASTINNDCVTYYNNLSNDIKGAVIPKKITVNKFENNDNAINASHASNAVIAGEAIDEFETNVYIPDVQDIEDFFMSSTTANMASAYSSNNLKELFNIQSSDSSILLRSQATNSTENYAIVNYGGSYQIRNQLKNTANASVRYMFKVDLSKVDFTIKGKTTFSLTSPKIYSINAYANDASYGTVGGNGNYTAGTRVTLSASPVSGCKFMKWGNPSIVGNPCIFIPTSDINVEAVFYLKRDPVKGEVLYFDSDSNKNFIVLNINGKEATLLSRDKYSSGVYDSSNKKYSLSGVATTLNGFASSFPADVQTAIKPSSIIVNKYESNDNALDASHASKAVIPGIKVEDVANVKAYLPGVNDIEEFFATSATTNMASVYSSNNLKELFNITDTTTSILLSSEDSSSSSKNYAIVKSGNNYQIVSQNKNTANCSIYPMFKVDLTSVEFTIIDKINFSTTTPKTYTISASSNNNNYGTVSGGGTYTVGTRTSVTPTPKTGYEFVQWNDGLYDVPRIIVVSKNENIVAQFEEDRLPVKGEIIRFNENGYYESYTVLSISGNNAVLLNRNNNTSSKYSNAAGNKYSESLLPNICSSFVNNLNATVKGKVSPSSFRVFSFDYFDGELEDKRASRVAFPGTNVELIESANAYVLDNIDLEKFFGGSDTLPGAFNSDSLKKMFNLSANDKVWLSSIDNTDSSKAYYVNCDASGKCSILSGSKTALSCKVRPTISVDLASLNYVITDKVDTELAPTTYTISVVSNNESYGTVEGGGTYRLGQKFTVKATPKQGYILEKWILNSGTNLGVEHEFTKVACLNTAGIYNAVFNRPQYKITLSLPASQSQWQDEITLVGSGTYYAGDKVTIKALFDENKFDFIGWDDDNNGDLESDSAEREIEVVGENTYYAYFSKKQFSINTTVEKVNDKTPGKITKDPNNTKHYYGDTVTLTATANDGYTFVKWSDDVTQNPRTITVTSTKNYVAIFKANHYKIAVNIDPGSADKGTVLCAGDAYYGSAFAIIARPKDGYDFDYWSASYDPEYKNYNSSSQILPDANWENESTITYTAHFKVKENFLNPGDVITFKDNQEGSRKYMVFKVESNKTITLFNLDNTLESEYGLMGTYFGYNEQSNRGAELDRTCNNEFYNKLSDKVKNNIIETEVKVYQQNDLWADSPGPQKEPTNGKVEKRKIYAAGCEDIIEFLGGTSVMQEISESKFASFLYAGNFTTYTGIPNMITRTRTSSKCLGYYETGNFASFNTDEKALFRPMFKLNMSSFVKDTDFEVIESERYDVESQSLYFVSCSVSPIGTGTIKNYTEPFFISASESYEAIALPNSGYMFDHWNVQYSDGTSENFEGSNHTFSNITRDMIITAYFKEDMSQMKFEVIGESSNEDFGSVTGSNLSAQYDTNVTLTATPKSGYRFKKWDDDSIENPRVIKARENVTYKATFEKLPSAKDVILINNASYRILDAADGNYTVMRLTKIDSKTKYGTSFSYTTTSGNKILPFFDTDLGNSIETWINGSGQSNLKSAAKVIENIYLYGYSTKNGEENSIKYWYKNNIKEEDISTLISNEYYLSNNDSHFIGSQVNDHFGYVVDLKEISSYFDGNMTPQDLIEFFTGSRNAVDEKIWLRSATSALKLETSAQSKPMYLDCNSGRIVVAEGTEECYFRPVMVLDLLNHPEVTYSVVSNAPTRYTVSVSCNEVEGIVYGGGTFPKSSKTTIKAEPKAGYSFVKWSNGSSINPLVIDNITGNLSYTAEFVKLSEVVKGDVITVGSGESNNKYLALDIENNIATLMCLNYVNNSGLDIKYRVNLEGNNKYTDLQIDKLCDDYFSNLSTPVKNAINAVKEENISLKIYSFAEDDDAMNADYHASRLSYLKEGLDSKNESIDHLVYIPSITDIETFFGAEGVNAGAFSKADLNSFFGGTNKKVLLRDYVCEFGIYDDLSKIFVYDPSKQIIDTMSSTDATNTTICPIIRMKLNSDGIQYDVNGHLSFNTSPLYYDITVSAKYLKDDSNVPSNYVSTYGSGTYTCGTGLVVGAQKTNFNAEPIFRKWKEINDTYLNTYITVHNTTSYTALFDNLPTKGTFISLTNAPNNHKEYIVVDVNSSNGIVYLLNRDYNVTSNYTNTGKYKGSSLQSACDTFVSGFNGVEEYKQAIAKRNVDFYVSDAFGTNDNPLVANKYNVINDDSTSKETISVSCYPLSRNTLNSFFTFPEKGVMYTKEDLKNLFGLNNNESVWLSNVISRIDNVATNNVCLGFDGQEGLITTITKDKNLFVRPVLMVDFTKNFAYEEKGTMQFSSSNSHSVTIQLVDDVYSPVSSDKYTIYGQGLYSKDEEVQLEIVPSNGYRFIRWSDNNTDNPRTIVVGDEDIKLNAVVGEYTALAKGQIITLDNEDQGHKQYVVLKDDNGKVTLLNRDNTVKGDNSSANTKCSEFANGFKDSQNKLSLIKNYSIDIYSYVKKDSVYDENQYAADVVYPGTKNNTVNNVYAYLPDIKDIQEFYSATATAPGAFSGNDLNTLFGCTDAVRLSGNNYYSDKRLRGNCDQNASYYIRPIVVMDFAKRSLHYSTGSIVTSSTTAKKHSITLNVNVDGFGTVTGSGNQFLRGSKATIKATPASGKKFFKWNDGNTDNPREVVIDNDYSFTAYFADDSTSYVLSVTANNSNYGTVTGGGTFNTPKDHVEIKATAKEGYKFVKWSDDNYDASRFVDVYLKENNYQAIFEPLPKKHDIINLSYVEDSINKSLNNSNQSYFVVDIDNNGIATLLNRDSTIVTTYLTNTANKVYEGSSLDNACTTFYNNFPQQIKDSIKDSTISTNQYASYDYLDDYVIKAKLETKQTPGSSITRKVYEPDVDDIVNILNSYSSNGVSKCTGLDIKNLLNSGNNSIWLRSYVDGQLNGYNFWSYSSTGNSIYYSAYNVQLRIRPMLKVDLSDNGVRYVNDGSFVPSYYSEAQNLVKGDFITINGEDDKHNDYMVFNVEDDKVYLLAKDHVHMEYINGSSSWNGKLTDEEFNNQLNTYKSGLSTNFQNLISSYDYKIYDYPNDSKKKNEATPISSTKDIESVSFYELQELLSLSDQNVPDMTSIFNIPYIDSTNVKTITTRDTNGGSRLILFAYQYTQITGTNPFNNTHVCPVFWIDLSKDTDNTFSYEVKGNYFTDKDTSHTVTFKDGDTPLGTKTFKVGERIIADTELTKNGCIFEGWGIDFMPNEDITVNAKWKVKNAPSKGSIIKLNDNKEYRVLSIDGFIAKVMGMKTGLSSPYSTDSAQTTFTNGSFTSQGIKYEGSTLDVFLNNWYAKLPQPMHDAIIPTNVIQNKYSYTDLPNDPTDFNNGEVTYKYQYQGSNDYDNYTYYGSVNVGERYVYELGVEDIYDYYGKNVVTSNEFIDFFIGDSTFSENEHSDEIWLNSAALNTYQMNDYNPVCFRLDRSYMMSEYDSSKTKLAYPIFTIDLAAEGVEYSVVGGGQVYNPVKGDLITISGEDEKYNDYVVLGVDGNNVKLALRDKMPSFIPNNIGVTDTNKFIQYIDDECSTFKGKLSQALQSSMVEMDYYSLYVVASATWGIGSYDDSQKIKYSNKYVCTISIGDVKDYLDSSGKEKYISTFFLSDNDYIVAREHTWNDLMKAIDKDSIGTRMAYYNSTCRLCPSFTIDLTKLTSNITLNGNIIND